MRTKAAFLIGGAVGYVFGTRAGREQFERMRTQFEKLWADPRVQSKVSDVEHRASTLVKEKGPELKDKVSGAVRSATDTVRSKVGEGDATPGEYGASSDVTTPSTATPPPGATS